MKRYFLLFLAAAGAVLGTTDAFENGGYIFDAKLIQPPSSSEVHSAADSMEMALGRLRDSVRAAQLKQSVVTFEERLESYPSEAVEMLQQILAETMSRKEKVLEQLEEHWRARSARLAELRAEYRDLVRDEALARCSEKAYERRWITEDDVDVFREWLDYNLERAFVSYRSAYLWTNRGAAFEWPLSYLCHRGSRRYVDQQAYQDARDFELHPLEAGESFDGYQLSHVARGEVRELIRDVECPIQAVRKMGGRMFGFATGSFRSSFYAERDRKLSSFFRDIDHFREVWCKGYQENIFERWQGAQEFAGRIEAFQDSLQELCSEIHEFEQQEELQALAEKSARGKQWLTKVMTKSTDLLDEIDASAEELKVKVESNICPAMLRSRLSDVERGLLVDFLDVKEPEIQEDLACWLKSASVCNGYPHCAEITKQNFLDWIEDRVDHVYYKQVEDYCWKCRDVAIQAANLYRPDLDPIVHKLITRYQKGTWYGKEDTYRARDFDEILPQEQRDEWREQSVAWFLDKMDRTIVPIADNLALIDDAINEGLNDYYGYIDQYLEWAEESDEIFRDLVREFVELKYQLLELDVKAYDLSALWEHSSLID